MPDINDVVRHVILRLIVDQAGFGEELAAASSKLSALKKAEKDANNERVKDSARVVEAIKAQKSAYEELTNAQESLGRKRNKADKDALASVKEHTGQIKDQTAAIGANAIAEARADAIRSKTAQDELDRISKRTQREKDSNRERIVSHREAQKSIDQERAQSAKAFERQLDDALAKIEQVNAKTRNINLGGQIDRTIKVNESNAKIDAADVVAGQRLFNTQKESEEKLATLKSKNQQDLTTRRLLDEEKVRKAVVQTSAAIKTIQDTLNDNIDTILQTNADKRDISANNRNRAETANVATEEALADRRAKSIRDAEIGGERLLNVQRQGLLLDMRAEDMQKRRNELLKTEGARRRENATLIGATLSTLKTLQTAYRAVDEVDPRTSRLRIGAEQFDDSRASGRGRTKSLVSGVSDAFSANTPGLLTGTRNVRRAISQGFSGSDRDGEGIGRKFIGGLRGGIVAAEGEASSAARRVFARVKAAISPKELPSGGAGGNLFGNVLRNLSEFSDAVTNRTRGLGRLLLSSRFIIVAVIAAFGPLAAIMGAVGAAALGLLSNLGALAGGLLALPGLIGAAVAGFAALGIALKPVGDVFDAFTAKQKAATAALGDGGKSAQDAARKLIDANRALQDAQLENARATEDLPRAERKLHDARVQAARDIQDYRLALQKLKFDQEGSELGVLSAERDYRRALADPTASKLDRQIARHGVEGALFDQRDQKVASGRLIDDAAQAEQRGVEGSDAVIDAKRAIEDANRRLEDSTIKLTRATEDLSLAQKINKAGGEEALKAQQALDAALAKLDPNARKVVKAILGLDGAYKDFQRRLQGRIFGPLADDTGLFATALGELETFLGPAADSIGKLASQALHLLTNPEWKAFFKSQGRENGYIIQQLGDAALSAANGFRSVVEVARPFTRFVVDGIKGMAKSFEGFATSKDGRDKISAFLALTRRRMQELYPVLKNFVGGIAGFFTALNTPLSKNGDDFTTKINKGLLGISEKFLDLGRKASDPNGGFQQWLRDVGPLIKDIAHFVGAVGSFFGDLFSDPDNLKEAESLLKNISDKWLPALAGIFDKLSQSGFISKLASGIGYVFEALNTFFDRGGLTAISVFGSILEKIGKVLAGIADSPLAPVLGVLTTIIATLAGAALFTKITGLGVAIRGLIGLYKLFTTTRDQSVGRVGGFMDAVKDRVLGRDSTETQARRQAEATRNETGKPKVDRTNTGGLLPTLYRMEKHLLTMIGLMQRDSLGGGDGDSSGKNSGGVGGFTRNLQELSRQFDRTGAAKDRFIANLKLLSSTFDGKPGTGPASSRPTGPGSSTRPSSNTRPVPGGAPGSTRSPGLQRGPGNLINVGGGPSSSVRRPSRFGGLVNALPLGLATADSGDSNPLRPQNAPDERQRRRLEVENSRRSRQGLTPIDLNLPASDSGNRFNPRSVRLADAATRDAETQLRNAAEPDAYDEQRRRDQQAMRPSAGRLTPAQRRREQANRRYAERNARLSQPTSPLGVTAGPSSLFPGAVPIGDLGDLAEQQNNPRRTRTTTAAPAPAPIPSLPTSPRVPVTRVGPAAANSPYTIPTNLFNPTSTRPAAFPTPIANPVETPRRRLSTTEVDAVRDAGARSVNRLPERNPFVPGFGPQGRTQPTFSDADDSPRNRSQSRRRTRSLTFSETPDTPARTTNRPQFSNAVLPSRGLGTATPTFSDAPATPRRLATTAPPIFDAGTGTRARDDLGRFSTPPDVPTAPRTSGVSAPTFNTGAAQTRDSRGRFLPADDTPTPRRTGTTSSDFADDTPTRDNRGRFLPRPSTPIAQTGDAAPGFIPEPQPRERGRFSSRGDRPRDRRDASTTQTFFNDGSAPSRGGLLDASGRGSNGRYLIGGSDIRRSRRSYPVNRLGDEGSMQLLPDNGRFLGIPLPGAGNRAARDEARNARRARTTAPSPQGSFDLASNSIDETLERTGTPQPSRRRRFSLRGRGGGGGGRRGLFGRRGRGRGRRGVPSAGAGAAAAGATYEDGYEDGYDDAEGGAPGPGGLPDIDLPDGDDDREPRKSRAERRAERRAARRGGAGGGGDDDGGERRRGGGRRGGGRRGGGGRPSGRGFRFPRLGGGIGGGLARGLAGGVGGVAASLALSLGGDAAINKFVKDDDDANSLSRGLGAVSTGAGIGATIGSVIPGVGTAIGGVVGGIAGGAYSLYKDKNLRNFVGGKISSGAKAVGGFFSKAGSAVSNFFGGGDDDDDIAPGTGRSGSGQIGKRRVTPGTAALTAALGPAGALLGGTALGGKALAAGGKAVDFVGKVGGKALDVGGQVVDSIQKAGKRVGDFFTKDIPGFFQRGVKGITDFFTKTLPGLPRKAIQGIIFGFGQLVGFFKYDVPQAANAAWEGITNFFTKTLPEVAGMAWGAITGFFTETLPNAASTAWNGITGFFTETLPAAAQTAWDGITNFFTVTIPQKAGEAFTFVKTNLFEPIGKFVTEDIPKFFTETIPKWFAEAPKWLNEHVVKPVTDFFTVKIPNFFTVTLPDAISKLPGTLYDNLVQPVLDFFGGLAGHVGDFLKGSWSWAKSLFSGAGDTFNAGVESRKQSGGLIEGIYQGMEDHVRLLATPEEFVVRRSKVIQPGGKQFLEDFNEGRIDPAMFYAALNQPPVMTVVPTSAPAVTAAAAQASYTTNAGLSMGDITINNPVREKSEYSLRRQIQIAHTRHRR